MKSTEAVKSTGNEKSTANEATTSGSENLFAIIGQVARPGVYRAPLSEPYLVDLIYNAGGFTSTANGYLRIIRRGPDGVQAIYASGRDFRLRPGDVIVANRKTELAIAPQAVRHSAASTSDAAAADELPSAYVQLAFVNLTDRPIVLRMRRENATVGQILEFLGHSPNLATTVHVIAPVDIPSPTLAGRQLISESVLVFDPSVMRPDRLPELPSGIVNDPHSRPATIATVHSATTLSDGPSSEVPPPIDLEMPQQTEDAKPPPALFEPPNLPAPPAKSSPPSSIRSLPSNLVAANDPLAPPDVSAAEAGGSGWLSVLIFSLFALTIGMASAWGIVQWTQRRMQTHRSALPAESADDEEPGNLSEIIYDQLPVVEESVTQSKHSAVFAHTGSHRHTRIDRAHAPPRPHFLPDTTVPDEQQPVQEPVNASVAATVSSGRQFRFDAKHDRETVRKPLTAADHAEKKEPQGLLDRVLSRVQGAANR